MATVYRGFDERLEVERAIKVLSPQLSGRADIRARFETEARTMAKLQHPNIVGVQDVGSDGERVYMVMELVETGSLIDLLDRRGAMSPSDACDAIIAILQGLQAAHARGIVHRDIKPHNVLVTPDGNYKVADFGIAHVTGLQRNSTRTGMAMGTLSYMAPEQRANAKQVDGRADIYAVSATFFALLTNEEPFELHAVDHQEEIFKGLPSVLVEVMKCASRFRPEDRYPDVAAMILAVRNARAALPSAEVRRAGASGGHPTLSVGADSYIGAVVPDAPTGPPVQVAPIASPVSRPSESGLSGATQAPLRSEQTFAVDPEFEPAPGSAVEDSSPSVSMRPIPGPSRPPVPSFVSDPFEEPPPAASVRGFVLLGGAGLVGAALLAIVVIGGIAWWQWGSGGEAAPVAEPVVAVVPPVVGEPGNLAILTPPVAAVPVAEPIVPVPGPATPVRVRDPIVKPPPVKKPVVDASAARPVVAVSPPAVYQSLFVNSQPYSNVVVDGKSVGTTGWNGSVSVGSHKVGLTTGDGRTKMIELTVKETEPKRFCWDFEAESECSR